MINCNKARIFFFIVVRGIYEKVFDGFIGGFLCACAIVV